jgi:hypothetical protein
MTYYRVEVRIPDNILVELTGDQFKQFRNSWVWDQVRLLGFSTPVSAIQWHDERYCSQMYIIQTNEVVKPSLFGHDLPYTAEVL